MNILNKNIIDGNTLTQDVTPETLLSFLDNPKEGFLLADKNKNVPDSKKSEFKTKYSVLATHVLDERGTYDNNKVDFSPHYMLLDLDVEMSGFITPEYPVSKAKEDIISRFGENIIRLNETLSGGLHILIKTGYNQKIYKKYHISRRQYAHALVTYIEDELTIHEEGKHPEMLIRFDDKSIEPAQRFMLYLDTEHYTNLNYEELCVPKDYLDAYTETFDVISGGFSIPSQVVESKNDLHTVNELVQKLENRCKEKGITLFNDRDDWVRMSFSLCSAGGKFTHFKKLSLLSAKEQQANERTLRSHWNSIVRNFDRSKSPSVSYLVQTAIKIGADVPKDYQRKKYTKNNLIEILTTVLNKNYFFGTADSGEIYLQNGDWINLEQECSHIESILRNHLYISGVTLTQIKGDINYIANINRQNGKTFNESEMTNDIFRRLDFYQNIPKFDFTQEGLLNHPYVREYKQLFNGFTELEHWLYIRMLFTTVNNYNRNSESQEVAPDMYVFHGEENGGKTRLIQSTFLPFTTSLKHHRYGRDINRPTRMIAVDPDVKNEFLINRIKAQSYILYDDEMYYWNSIRYDSAKCKQFLSQSSISYQMKGQNSMIDSVRNYTYVSTTNVDGITFDRSSQRRYFKIDFDYRNCEWRFDPNDPTDTNDDIIWKLWALVVYCHDNGFNYMDVKDWFTPEIRKMQAGQRMDSDEESILKDVLVFDKNQTGVRSTKIKQMICEISPYHAKNFNISTRSITSILKTMLKEQGRDRDIYTTNKSGSVGFRVRLRQEGDYSLEELEDDMITTSQLTDKRNLFDDDDELNEFLK